MSDTARPFDPAALVAHADGLRALARSLLGDTHLAEDVVQEAMAAAVRRPPAEGVPLGPWLVGVVRNLSRFTARSRSRRAVRERAVVVAREEPPVDEAVARTEVHKKLVEAVLALDEPYRTTLILRYLEGREPTEIARATGVPAATVRTRVHRGLALLRDALRGGKDDDAWRLALLPLVGRRAAPPATAAAGLTTGVLLMTAKTKAAAALLVLLAGTIAFLAAGDDPPPAAPERDAETAATPVQAVPRTRSQGKATDSAAKIAPDAAAAAPAASAAERAKWPIRVTTNVPGAKVSVQPEMHGGDERPPARTKTADAAGFVGFEVDADPQPSYFEFIARAEGWETKRHLEVRAGDVKIEMRRAAAIRGRVVDLAGAPVVGATVVVADGPQWTVAATNENWAPAPETAADGSFEAFVAAAGPATLHVEHHAFLARDVSVVAPTTNLIVTLDRGLSVAGRVAFPDGRPLPETLVEAVDRGKHAWTDADGRYVVSGLARESVPLKCAITDETRTAEAGATGVDFVVDRPVARLRYVDVKGRPYRWVGMFVRVHKDGIDVYSEGASGGVENGDELIPGTRGATLMVAAHATKDIRGGATLEFGEEARLHDVPVVLGVTKPKGTLRVVVRSGSNETPPVAHISVEDETGANPVGGGRTKRYELDAAGAVEIPDVPVGRVKVGVAAEEHWSAAAIASPIVTARVSADVEAGRTSEVVATFVVGGRIRALVKDESGAPIAPHGVRLTTSSDGQFSDVFVRPNPGGGWTSALDTTPAVLLDAVVPGRYVVRATTKDGEVVEKDVEVRRGETTDVELVVKPKR